ncbi:D-2-hydroxyacid dehydrogenase [Paenibacillus sacheonensis]|uniref:D-2-hydroxyacid dehydrogenase n=1 Tax=Paenibacillus sacheonensis TaxID=742054 RepID=A0A7X4YRT3_9BACL|nr:D-2-hydroxyacid dehydrogenase [Paenibacillus sacheonensis]MBM7567547.1 phosphoglycerate dehydrogenase-like enzyme [Paenibacillus sacheonensis]NBC71348.1 D-2-hydroxyacid dehydrogenase [Paenibacillus sacheonensis]
MRTILCLRAFTPEQQAAVRSAAPNETIVFGQASELEDRDYLEAEVILGWDAKVKDIALREDSKLRWVQSWSSGIDSLPLDLLERRGILLTDASGVHARSVSETAAAMMLGLSRGIVSAVRNQREQRWESPETLAEMNGGTVAIIGAGEIGREVARLARAFDMRIAAVSRSGRSVPEADVVYDTAGLDDALREADYVVNILPLTDETRHLFHAERFAVMKRSAYFINVGRGATVRTDDLVAALNQGVIAGAGLDVFEQEPLPAGHPLWAMENVIVTPHNAGGMTVRNNERLIRLFASNLGIYLSSGPGKLRNLVDYGKKY